MTEHEAIDAFLSAWTTAEAEGDTAELGRRLSDDFVSVGPLGFTLSKQEWIGRHGSTRLVYEKFELNERRQREYGDAVTITALNQVTGTFGGNPLPTDLRVTAVLAREDGEWRLATLHMSFVAGTPGAPPVPGRPG